MNPAAFSLPALPEINQAVEHWARTQPDFADLLVGAASRPKALAQWGLQLIKAGKAAEASDVFRVAAALQPDQAVHWANCGIALDQAGRPAEAAECLARSVALAHAQPDIWLLLGLARKKCGDAAGAEAAYRTALQLEPRLAVAWQCLGLLKEEQHDDRQAIDCLMQCLKCGGVSAAICANLGKLLYQIGDISRAHDAFSDAVQLDADNQHYRQMLRKCRFIRDARDGVALDDALAVFRESFPASVSDTAADLPGVLNAAFGLLSGFGHTEAAERVGRKYLEMRPGDPEMEYLLQALQPGARPDRSPVQYVARHFDAFAEGFDQQLVARLGYDVPDKIDAALREVLAPEGRLDVLDAGCGTGLCGPLLRPFARTLTGVDLAPKMIEHAARRGTYDRLECAELIGFLEKSPGTFDLVVAADVLVYLGDLAPFMSSAARVLRPGGLLVFSTESTPDGSYRMQTSGRFAHAAAYVRAVAAPGFTEQRCLETTIRLHANARLPGNLFLLRRRGD